MMSYSEINEILKNTKSYNRSQIGSNKQLVIAIYDYFYKINLSRNLINDLLNYICFMEEKKVNIPLYLDLVSKSLEFINDYSLKEVLDIVLDVHDVYVREFSYSLEEYLHDTNETRLKKLFLDRNTKYVLKDFSCVFSYVNELKFVAAIALDKKDYNEFINYIDDFSKYCSSYSPFRLFSLYLKMRNKLKGKVRLFWDLVYGNEFILALYKSNVKISDICGVSDKKVEINSGMVQVTNVNVYQICDLYKSDKVFNFKQEKEFMDYIKSINKKEKGVIELPKLKNEVRTKYVYKEN